MFILTEAVIEDMVDLIKYVNGNRIALYQMAVARSSLEHLEYEDMIIKEEPEDKREFIDHLKTLNIYMSDAASDRGLILLLQSCAAIGETYLLNTVYDGWMYEGFKSISHRDLRIVNLKNVNNDNWGYPDNADVYVPFDPELDEDRPWLGGDDLIKIVMEDDPENSAKGPRPKRSLSEDRRDQSVIVFW